MDEGGSPILPPIDVLAGLPLQVSGDFLNLAPPRTGIVCEVTEFARVGLDVCHIFLVSRIAPEDENLVLRPALLADCIHIDLPQASRHGLRRAPCSRIGKAFTFSKVNNARRIENR